MGIYKLLLILAQTQLPVDGLDKAVGHGDVNKVLVWVISIIGGLLITIVGILWREYARKNKQWEDSKDDYAKKIEDLTRAHNQKMDEINMNFIKKLEEIRVETTKKNDDTNSLLMGKVDEWNKQWAESERYAMDVIKGLNKLIENNDIMTSNRHTQILDKLTILENNLTATIKSLQESFNKNG